MKTGRKRLLILLLVVIVLLAVWIFDKYQRAEDLPPTGLSASGAEEPIKVNNVINTTVSVVESEEELVE